MTEFVFDKLCGIVTDFVFGDTVRSGVTPQGPLLQNDREEGAEGEVDEFVSRESNGGCAINNG